jgi:beta-glucosidase
MSVDTRVGARALREIYLPAFRAAVQEGGARFVMAAYNKVNGHYACESRLLLTDILKSEWGFRGAVISDWGAVHSTLATARAGLDLEMGGTTFFGQPLLSAVREGTIPESLIDEKVRRLMRVMMLTGIFDEPWQPRLNAEKLYKRPTAQGDFTRSMYDMPTRFDNDLLDGPAHRALALRAAREGMVLLKNEDGILPLHRDKVRSIAVIGPNAAWGNRGGGGSSEVRPSYVTTPLEAILKKVGDRVEVRYELGTTFDRRYYVPLVKPHHLLPPAGVEGDNGLRGEYFDNPELAGQPVLTRLDPQVFFHWGTNPPAEDMPAQNWSVRWTGSIQAPQSGDYKLYLFHHGAFYANEQGDGARLYIDDQLVIDNWRPVRCRVPSAIVALDAEKPSRIRLEYHDAGPGKQAIMILGWLPNLDDPIARAARCASQCDVAILCLGDNHYYGGENNDRGDLRLPGDQEALIKAVTAANPKTIVALYNGSPFLMEEWVDKAPAVVECWYPNQEGGAALADILFGDTNPCGKLPVTIGRRREDYPDFGNYPGDGEMVTYEEGIYVGYRHFDKRGIAPRFPFGYGLSYSTFAYDNLKIGPSTTDKGDVVTVSCRITNTGDRFGKEVAQLYLHDDQSTVDRPEKELKRFQKIALDPGESAKIAFRIGRCDLSFFDIEQSAWKAEAGRFTVLVGASSRDIRLRGTFEFADRD